MSERIETVVLAKAKDIVEERWCAGHLWEKDSEGKESLCLMGALIEARYVLGLLDPFMKERWEHVKECGCDRIDPYRIPEAKILMQAGKERIERMYGKNTEGYGLMDYNDTQGDSSDVILLLDEAIDLSREKLTVK